MNNFRNYIKALFVKWCDAMLSYQIHSENPRVNGALICPACGKIHGRCFEAIYPFMEMASLTGDSKWIKASEDLLAWSEHTVSLSSGGYINDIDSDWEGISVFACIMMIDALDEFSSLMDDSFRGKLEARALRVVEYLYQNESLKKKNTNYPVSNALALYKAGVYFKEQRFIEKSEEYEKIIYTVFTPSYLVFGEGWARDMKSPKGLLAVDIGYNVEETLPSIALLGIMKEDQNLIDLAVKGFRAQLDFMLSDGGWDNSFGTRNLKWTYWGSRTSDGAATALLMLAAYDKSFAPAAIRNIELMGKCTADGLLAGGPDYEKAGQPQCIHHSFTHSKILAVILSRGLADDVSRGCNVLPRYQNRGLRYKDDLDTYIFSSSSSSYSATVTGYDWPYLKGGHTSGGMLSLLEFSGYGPIVASSMGHYFMKEKNNMQVPYGDIKHECLDFRIEKKIDGIIYSSRYADDAVIEKLDSNLIKASGFLKSEEADVPNSAIPYSVQYIFSADRVEIRIESEASLIIPFISRAEKFVSDRLIRFEKNGVVIEASVKNGSVFSYPYGAERIFNLVPGFLALRTEIYPDNNIIELVIRKTE